MEVTGTQIWYFFICQRETWLILHQIAADQDDENLDIGRFISEHSYKRDKKEVVIGNIKVDRVRKSGNDLIIGEVKKSSRYRKSSTFQLLYYLYSLSKMGIEAKGELLYPQEKRKESVELTDKNIEELENAIVGIRNLARQPIPPQPEKISFCKKCAYREYCWAEG